MAHKPLVLAVLVILLQSRREKYESTERCAYSILKDILCSDEKKHFLRRGASAGVEVPHQFFTVLVFEPHARFDSYLTVTARPAQQITNPSPHSSL